MYYLEIIKGVVKEPNATLDRIAREHYISAGVVIWVLSLLLDFFATLLSLYQTAGGKQSLTTLAVLVVKHNTLLGVFAIYVYVFLVNLVAAWVFKFPSKYLSMLSCTFFILVIGILNKCLSLVLVTINAASIRLYIAIPFIIWIATLQVIAIMKVYGASVRTASKIWGVSLVVAFFLIHVLPS